MRKVITMRDELEAAANAANVILTAAETAGRELTAGERNTIDQHLARAKELKRQMLDAQARYEDAATLDARLAAGDIGTGRLVRSGGTRFLLGAPAGSGPEGTGWLPSFSEYFEGLQMFAQQGESTGSSGGYTVPIQHVAEIYDRLRTASVFLKAGPRIVTMTSRTAVLPGIGTGVSVAVVAENTPIPTSEITFERVELRARKVAALTPGSNEWFNDSNPAGRQILAGNMLKELATKIDELAFAGSGVGENPLGMRNWVGAPATAIAGPITLDVIATMIGNLEARGATPSAIFLSPANWTALLGLKDDNGAFLLVPNPSDSSPRRLFGIPVYVSMHVGEDWAAVADMSQIVFGRREEIQIAYDGGGAFFEADQTAVRAIARFDVAPLNVEGVELATNLT